ncbi:MAG: diguanylate cyclase, partial [Woeseia sp.]
LGRLIRLGGDEFLIVYWGDDPDTLIEKAIRELQKSPVARTMHGQHVVTLSAGIVSSGLTRPADLEGMYKTADKALYDQKQVRQSNTRPAFRIPDGETEQLLARTGSWTL